MQNSVKLRALKEIYDEDFKTQATLKYPNIPKGEIVEYLGEFHNLFGCYVKVLWNDRTYNTTWDKLEVINNLSEIYYRQRDGSFYTKMTKDEIAQKIDPTKLSTFVPILKDMNYVIMLDVWFNYYSRHPTSRGTIGRYISYMHLKAIKPFDYNSSQFYYDIVKKRKEYNAK